MKYYSIRNYMSQNFLHNYVSNLSNEYHQHPEVQQMVFGLEGIMGPHFDSTIVDVCVERQAWKELCEELYDVVLAARYKTDDWETELARLTQKIEDSE
jgi:hypothetical protein